MRRQSATVRISGNMKPIGGFPFSFLVIFAAACTAVILRDSKYDRYVYFAGDDETDLTIIDTQELVDEEFIRHYTENPDNNGYWLFTRCDEKHCVYHGRYRHYKLGLLKALGFASCLSNPVTPQILRYNDTETLKNSNFHNDKMVVILVHGWRGSSLSNVNSVLTEAFLQHQDLNVIVFDWSAIAARNYMTAKKGVLSVGSSLGRFISWLQSCGVSLQQMHLVGHSLGGHLVGNAGRYLHGAVRRITGLDPAGPLWHLKDSGSLKYSDGQYVEVIHTNILLLGYNKPLGHTDFYPNGGKIQPGCGSTQCSHSRAYEYMAASILYNHLKAHRCTNMLSMKIDKCGGIIELMGNSELRIKPRGIYRLNTEKAWPYDVIDKMIRPIG